jgi:hypothetical protein
MTNDQLADEIEREGVERVIYGMGHAKLIELNQKLVTALRVPCPHIRTSDEGTSYCELAESATCPPGMVCVPREPTDAMMKAANPAFATVNADWSENDPPLKQAWRLMIAAHEAEGK